MIFNFLTNIVTIDKDIIKISPDFCIKDKDHAKEVLSVLEVLFKELRSFGNKGYINDPSLNLPVVDIFTDNLRIFKGDKQVKFKASILLNNLYYNLVLMLTLNLLIKIEIEITELDPDLKADLKNLRSEVLRMIHPCIVNKISKKGISLMLNTFSGFDSEYELESSLELKNELISIQIASTTSLYVKVPKVKIDPLQSTDFKFGYKELRCEQTLIRQCCKSIDALVVQIRSSLFVKHDHLINRLNDELSFTVGVRKYSIEDYNLYTFPKTEVKTLIRYLTDYNSTSLIKDSEDLNNEEHYKTVSSFMLILNKLSGIKVINDKQLVRIKESVDKPTSRIVYRFGINSKCMLSISIRRNLYLCMHESAADLSMLSDIDEFKQSLDIVGRAFVTRGKPLIIDECKSRVHLRDTFLLAPQGAKSLAGLGEIYGSEFKKVDIGNYRNGRMKALLKDNKELFEKYAITDSLITLKHACSMEEFYLSVDKIGVPLTLSGIGKAYVIKE